MKIIVEFESSPEEEDSIFSKKVIRFLSKNKELKYSILSTQSGITTFDLIEKNVCDLIGITPLELRESKRQKREIVEARQICHYIAKKNNLGSLVNIGFRFGRKDHSTVLYSVKTVTNLLQTNIEFIHKYKTFVESFK